MFANLCRRYAACAAKKLAECAKESLRWEENVNWQIQGCNVVASHLDTLHATVDKSLYLDMDVDNFRSRVFANGWAASLREQPTTPAEAQARGENASGAGASPTLSYRELAH